MSNLKTLTDTDHQDQEEKKLYYQFSLNEEQANQFERSANILQMSKADFIRHALYKLYLEAEKLENNFFNQLHEAE